MIIATPSRMHGSPQHVYPPVIFQGFLIYLTVAMYPRRGDPGEPPGICAMIFTNMFLSIILSKRSKLSSQEAW